VTFTLCSDKSHSRSSSMVVSGTAFTRPRSTSSYGVSFGLGEDCLRIFAKIFDSIPGDLRGWAMRNVELFRRRAEECLERASQVSERQRVRLLLVQAHNHLKQAEETEAQELNARG
jgi:hypothetical protein